MIIGGGLKKMGRHSIRKPEYGISGTIMAIIVVSVVYFVSCIQISLVYFGTSSETFRLVFWGGWFFFGSLAAIHALFFEIRDYGKPKSSPITFIGIIFLGLVSLFLTVQNDFENWFERNQNNPFVRIVRIIFDYIL
jgi:hypothetical protein